MGTLSPIPRATTVVTAGTWLLNYFWDNWLQALVLAINSTAQQTGVLLGLTAQSASLPATTLLTVVSEGVYRVNYAARITQAAGATSALTVTVTYQDGGVLCSFPGLALTANTTTTRQSSVSLIHCDAGSLITISTTYASTGVPAMTYRLDSRVESLP